MALRHHHGHRVMTQDAAPANRAKVRRVARRRRRLYVGGGAAVELLVDGEQFMPAIEQALSQARQQILIETYIIASDETGGRIVDLLCDQARAGVDVWAVFDAIGASRLSKRDRRRLTDAGVHLRMFNRLRLLRPLTTFFRTHRRIVVVDGQVGFVGGFGFADEWVKPDGRGGPWHEMAWRVRGLPLRHLAQTFARTWRQHKPMLLPVVDAPEDLPFRIMNKVRWGSQRLRRRIVGQIRSARQRIWLTTGYFVPGPFLLAALRHAARRGVDVRLLLTGPKSDHPMVHHAGRRHYGGLLKAGVRIYETRDRMMHAKTAVVDADRAIVGSSNLDNWSLRYNREINLEVISREAAEELCSAMATIQEQSTPITYEAWQRRPLLNRILERLFGIADDLL